MFFEKEGEESYTKTRYRQIRLACMLQEGGRVAAHQDKFRINKDRYDCLL